MDCANVPAYALASARAWVADGDWCAVEVACTLSIGDVV